MIKKYTTQHIYTRRCHMNIQEILVIFIFLAWSDSGGLLTSVKIIYFGDDASCIDKLFKS